MKMRPMLTLEDCKKISAASEAEAKKNNWNVCIAILDDGGHETVVSEPDLLRGGIVHEVGCRSGRIRIAASRR